MKDSRPTVAGRRRRKVCRACGHRWSTIEVILPDDMKIGDGGFDLFAALRRTLDETIRQLQAIRATIPDPGAPKAAPRGAEPQGEETPPP